MAWAGRGLNDHLVPTPRCGSSCHPQNQALNQVVEGPIQPGHGMSPKMGHPQLHWSACMFVAHHLLSKEFPPNVVPQSPPF